MKNARNHRWFHWFSFLGAAMLLLAFVVVPAAASTDSDSGTAITASTDTQRRVGVIVLHQPEGTVRCSGVIIEDVKTDRSLVATVGHCAYKHTRQEFNNALVFIPNYAPSGIDTGRRDLAAWCEADQVGRGCWVVRAVAVHVDWAASADPEHDVAFYAFDASLQEQRGAVQIAFGGQGGSHAEVLGFPANSPWNGSDLVRCAGQTRDESRLGGISLPCRMGGGSSGGPWLYVIAGQQRVVGLTAYIIAQDELSADRWTNETRQVWDFARTMPWGSRAVVTPAERDPLPPCPPRSSNQPPRTGNQRPCEDRQRGLVPALLDVVFP